MEITPASSHDLNMEAHRAGIRVFHDDGGQVIVSGLELRYLLTTLILEASGPLTVEALADRVRAEGLTVRGRSASKVVSDALRWEVGRGRVVRHRRGVYGPGVMPRQTRSRIRTRVHRIRAHLAMVRRLAA